MKGIEIDTVLNGATVKKAVDSITDLLARHSGQPVDDIRRIVSPAITGICWLAALGDWDDREEKRRGVAKRRQWRKALDRVLEDISYLQQDSRALGISTTAETALAAIEAWRCEIVEELEPTARNGGRHKERARAVILRKLGTMYRKTTGLPPVSSKRAGPFLQVVGITSELLKRFNPVLPDDVASQRKAIDRLDGIASN